VAAASEIPAVATCSRTGSVSAVSGRQRGSSVPTPCPPFRRGRRQAVAQSQLARRLLCIPAVMKFPQLVATIRDPMNSLKIEQAFVRSPVTVGRAEDNALRLDSRIVSRHHGAFLFGESGLHYVDVGSANGSFVDGRFITPNAVVEVGSNTIITVGPFQIGVELRLVRLPRFPSDPLARTSLDLAPSDLRRARALSDETMIDQLVRGAIAARGPIGALRRAVRVVETVSEVLLGARPATTTGSPLDCALEPGAVVRYLLELDLDQDRIGELRARLALLMRSEPSRKEPALVIVQKDGEA
jgi:FHA domain